MANDSKVTLDNLMIAAPCNVGWENMTGTGAVRHCYECKLNVYDISEMTSSEAEALLRSDVMNAGRACVSFYRRADGTILTKDCPQGLAKVRATAQKALRAIAATLTVLFASVPAFGDNTAKKSATSSGQTSITTSTALAGNDAPGSAWTSRQNYGISFRTQKVAYDFDDVESKANTKTLKFYNRGQKTENEGKIASALYYYRQAKNALQDTPYDTKFGIEVYNAVKRTEKSLKLSKQMSPDCPKEVKERWQKKRRLL